MATPAKRRYCVALEADFAVTRRLRMEVEASDEAGARRQAMLRAADVPADRWNIEVQGSARRLRMRPWSVARREAQ